METKDSQEESRAKRLAAVDRYRVSISDDGRHSQDQFDKAIMTLSASGIGVTLTLLDKVIPFDHSRLKSTLFLAWIYWALSLTSTLCSFFASTRALLWAERQLIKEYAAVKIALEPDNVPAIGNLGGGWNRATQILNAAAMLLFFSGLLALIIFVCYNIRNGEIE